MWPIILSDQLRIFGLVEPLPHQLPNPTRAHLPPAIFDRLSVSYGIRGSNAPSAVVGDRFSRITHPFATLPVQGPGLVRLACVRPAASVHSEPGSNSSFFAPPAGTHLGPILNPSVTHPSPIRHPSKMGLRWV